MMELGQAIKQRHSVRAYLQRPLEDDLVRELEQMIAQCNRDGGLHIQLVRDEPRAFDSRLARYGKFSGVSNYIALVGRKGPELDEKCGYYGEKLVLWAQQMGLNTCWVGLTYKKIPDAFRVGPAEKLVAVIALGYGATQGVSRRSKTIADVCTVNGAMPDWFRRGAEAALLAPTAVNQQKFHFTLDGNKVRAAAGLGFYSKVDLGIVKYHFEVGAGPDNFTWA